MKNGIQELGDMAVQQKVKTRKHKCPPHHFIINSENVGRCKYCPAVKDFGEILRREGYFASSKSKKGGKKGKRGRKKKEELL